MKRRKVFYETNKENIKEYQQEYQKRYRQTINELKQLPFYGCNVPNNLMMHIEMRE